MSWKFALFSLISLSSPFESVWAAEPGCRLEENRWTGAYMRQIRTQELYRGVEGQVTLPQVTFDPAREFKVDHSLFATDPTTFRTYSKYHGPMDHPSVYLGATRPAHYAEIDTGVSWMQIQDSEGRNILVSTSDPQESALPQNWYRLDPGSVSLFPTLKNPHFELIATGWEAIQQEMQARGLRYFFAFAPFYRTTIPNKWQSYFKTFYLPGERIQFVLSHDANLFTLKIISRRGEFKTQFNQKGFENNQLGYSFKRVNAIDQYRLDGKWPRGNEGPAITVIPTEAQAMGSRWDSFLGILPNGRSVPISPPGCIDTRFRDLVKIYDRTFTFHWVGAQGGESIDIHP